jgi:hypothetical protein
MASATLAKSHDRGAAFMAENQGTLDTIITIPSQEYRNPDAVIVEIESVSG